MKKGLRLHRLAVFWYLLTQRASFRRQERRDDLPPVAPASSVVEIVQRLGSGTRYRKDPLGGKLDIFRHPRVVQRQIDEGERVGDCDEHGGYLCAAIVKSNLAARVWFVFLAMENSAHAFCVFQLEEAASLYLWWVDYHEPQPCADWAEVMRTVAAVYGSKPVGLVHTRVTGLDDRDGLKLGSSSVVYADKVQP